MLTDPPEGFLMGWLELVLTDIHCDEGNFLVQGSKRYVLYTFSSVLTPHFTQGETVQS